MSSRIPAYIVPSSLALTAVLAFALLQAAHSASKPPKIEARSAPLLKVGEHVPGPVNLDPGDELLAELVSTEKEILALLSELQAEISGQS